MAKKGMAVRDATGSSGALQEVLKTTLIHEGLTCGTCKLPRSQLSTKPVFVFLHPTVLSQPTCVRRVEALVLNT